MSLKFITEEQSRKWIVAGLTWKSYLFLILGFAANTEIIISGHEREMS